MIGESADSWQSAINEKVMRERDMKRSTRVVVCAAIMEKRQGIVVCGARHWDPIMCSVADALGLDDLNCEQGFIDNGGIFLDRQRAYLIAEEAGQLGQFPHDGSMLYSEDLY